MKSKKSISVILVIFFAFLQLLMVGCQDARSFSLGTCYCIEEQQTINIKDNQSRNIELQSPEELEPLVTFGGIDPQLAQHQHNSSTVTQLSDSVPEVARETIERRGLVNPVYVSQAKELAAPTSRLAIAVQGVIEYKPVSQGLTDEQILDYIYTQDSSLGQIFSRTKVIFERSSNGIIVSVYANDRQTILVRDDSRTTVIDYIYGNN